MSTALAIASVTWVLKDLLNDGLINQDVTGVIGSTVTVTTLPPDRIETSEANEQSQLNLFMYQATSNQGWQNKNLPSLNAKGERIHNPPLALDLHYLLTAYGSSELHHEILLGYGMQLLHETPVLIRDAIRRSLAPTLSGADMSDLPPSLRALSSSELAEQVEQIKISPEVLNTEEMSKLWAAFQAKYRPTATYRATVLLIESRRSTRSSLPVQQRKLYAIPFNQPLIEQVKSQATPDAAILRNQKILADYWLVLEGKRLKAEAVSVSIDGIAVMPSLEGISDTMIRFMLPPSLKAGVHGVQVIHSVMMGEPPNPHQGVRSKAEAFILSPRIEHTEVSDVEGSGDTLRSAAISLHVIPAVGETQKILLLLNELQVDNPPAPPNAYSFQAQASMLLSPPNSGGDILVHVRGVKAGTYLARIQIDGAESPLGADASGKYNSPQLTIP